jgi:hypothetical protein
MVQAILGEGGINESQGVGGVGLRITILPPTHIAQFKTARNTGKAGGRGYTLAPLHFAAKEVSLYFILTFSCFRIRYAKIVINRYRGIDALWNVLQP